LDNLDLEQNLPSKPSNSFWENIKHYPIYLISLSKEERDACILKILKTLEDKNLVQAGRKRQNDWFKGWEENLKNFSISNDIKDLIPKYYNKFPYIRYKSELYRVKKENTELNSVRILINYIADIYLRDFEEIIEIGAGTCHHILELSKNLQHNPNFYALDWSESTTLIAERLKKKNHIRSIYSFKFDFFNPTWHKEIKLPKDNESVIYSFAALEQIGQEFHNLFNFIKNKIKPKLIIHLEPIAELLPQDELLSYLSTKYFYKRNYLNGYYSFLKQKEKEGEIIIHQASRMPFGSLFIEGYSLIVWSPR